MSLQEICIAKHNEKIQQHHQSEEEYKMHHNVQLVSSSFLFFSLAFKLIACILYYTIISIQSDSSFKKMVCILELQIMDFYIVLCW